MGSGRGPSEKQKGGHGGKDEKRVAIGCPFYCFYLVVVWPSGPQCIQKAVDLNSTVVWRIIDFRQPVAGWNC